MAKYLLTEVGNLANSKLTYQQQGGEQLHLHLFHHSQTSISNQCSALRVSKKLSHSAYYCPNRVSDDQSINGCMSL